jgi:S-adenosylmethionine hydrolase
VPEVAGFRAAAFNEFPPTMPRPLITFTSDFGHDDWFVGVVHGVIHAVCPETRVVDLTHDIPPGHIARAAFVLEASARDFPPGTVHLAVVDPGVGTDRRPLAVRARGQFFVGPDNGLLEWGLADQGAEVHAVSERRYFRQPVSRTFHARDVFAPVAAHLARGERIGAFGARIADPVRLDRPRPRRVDGRLVGRVAFVDHFGNAITDLTEQDLSDAFPRVPETGLQVLVAGRLLRGLARAYGDAQVGTLLAIIGSSGRLEIAQVGGNAAERLGLGEGDQVAVGVGEA